MSSNRVEESRRTSPIGNPPSDGEPSYDNFESDMWWEWPKWTPYGYRKSESFPEILEPMLDLDKKQCTAWKEEVQNLLILAGLFSAVVTAFVIESYQTLQPDPNDQIIALLSLITGQMNATIEDSVPQTASFPTTSFVPSPTNIRVNIYWFISLVLSLTVALIGIIVQQWLREHQLYRKDLDGREQFAIFNARSDGLQRWYVPQIFAGLPLLLQTALVLFFIGLVEFLFSIQINVAIPVFAAVAVPIFFLATTTILPTLQLCTMQFPYLLRVNDCPPAPCPYKSPQALIFQNVAILSPLVFDLLCRAFSIFWIPFVIVIRLFVGSGKPFYTKGAPFSTEDPDYRCSRDNLRKAASKWTTMDTQWLATRTSYAVAIQTPIAVRHLQCQYISNTNLIEVIGFYDWVTSMKQLATNSDPTDWQHRRSLSFFLGDGLERLFQAWNNPIKASRTHPGVAQALQARFAGLLRIISPCNYQQTEDLVGLSNEDIQVVANAFFAVFIDQAWDSELNFYHYGVSIRLATHMKMTCLYLLHNAHELFVCPNLPGITPYFSVSARPLFAHHRSTLESTNKFWMQCFSRVWSETLRQVTMDAYEMTPSKPFTQRCTGSSTSRCGSNLHTKSIVELTEYILLFQVSDDIQQTLFFLHDLCISRPNPVQERPFVLIIACAYIDAVANVNQDDVEGFSTLLHMICDLCVDLKPALEVRPGGAGRYWPSLDSAFDHIRSHACKDQGIDSAAPASQAPELTHNVDAADNV